MCTPKLISCLLVLVLSNVIVVFCQTSRCIVVAPRSIRSNSDYALSITTHGAAEPLQFRVKIYEREDPRSNRSMTFKPNKKNIKQDAVDGVTKRGPKPKLMKMTNEDKFSKDVKVPVTGMKTKTITVQPDVPQIIKFKYDKDIQPGSYILEVVSLSSAASSTFYEKQFLSVESETVSIFIQTNKASYRPGDMCKYRIVVTDADTRPVVIDNSLVINIYDASKTLVHMKTKQSAKKGVNVGEFQINTRGKKGAWQIEVDFKGKQIRKQFEVTKIERPNFQVIARTPTFVSNNSTQFSVGVECYYSFGKPITGMAVIKATPILQSSNSWTETAKPVTSTKDVRGIYFTTFQMADFKIPKLRQIESFLVETMVQEKATGAVVQGYDITVPMDYKRVTTEYIILLIFFKFFVPGQIISINVHVYAKSGKALPAAMQSVKLAVAFDSDLTEASTYTSYDLDANGKTEIKVQVPVTTVSKLHVKVKNGENSEEATVLAKKLHVQVISTASFKLGQKIQFQVGCREVPAKLFYYVVGRGNILVSQVIDMASRTVGVFEFESELAMAPSSSLVVYYVSGTGELISDETEFAFEPEILANPLNVTVSETRLKPNQELIVTLKTGDNSQVIMSAVDQNVLLEGQGNDLSKNKVFNGLRLYDNAGDMDLDASYSDTYNKLLKSGALVLTDAMKFKAETLETNNITRYRRDIIYDYTADIQTNIVIPLQPICSYVNLTAQEQLDLENTTAVRSKFSDTLLWQDVEYAGGIATLKTTVPETMTSWILTGYSLSANSGLGFLQTPVVLTTFKPFFTDVKVAGSCKLGDVIDVQVAVHNYMDQVSRVEVTLDDTAGDFEIINPGRGFSDYVDYDENYVLRNLKRTTFQVVGDGVRSTTFSVKPKKVGPTKLKIQTISSVACDTIEKTVMVEPPGRTITRTVTRPIFITQSQPIVNSLFEIKIPPNAVPGSTKVQFSIQGDKYSLELENKKPLATDDGDVLTSLFMQSLNVFGPGATATCQSANALTDVINAVNNFAKSQCSDGGFRIDGDCDQASRDTTYTARTLVPSATAVKLKVVSPMVLIKGFEWLASIQRADGSFPNPIPYPPTFVEGPITTSYVLYSLLLGCRELPELKSKHAATISKAMDNLFAQVDSLDILSLAFLGRAVQLNQDARKNVILSKLNRLAMKNELTQRWTRSALLDEALPYIYDIYEIDGDIVPLYKVGNGVMQYLVDNFDQIPTASLKNMLITSVDYFGAFSNTLIMSNYLMTVSFASSNPTSTSAPTTVMLDANNRYLQSTFELDPNTKTINATVNGLGLATLEMTYEYNLLASDVVDAYSLQLTLTPAMSKEWRLSVCASSKVTPNPTDSVMEIKFPPGFNTTEFIQDQDDMTLKIKKKELKGDGMTVIFEGLDSQPACFVVPIYRNTFVNQPLVGTVTLEDQDFKNEKPHLTSAEYMLSSFDSIEIIDP